mmetsp:Transcript_87830/g.227986  ORF Transcript_87830/g.227986 Transcript_87830/m.227986 type:complete len:138 (+) Transcript_87830:89-502(+)
MLCCCAADDTNAAEVIPAVDKAEPKIEEKAEPKKEPSPPVVEEKAAEEAAKPNDFVFKSGDAEKNITFTKAPFGMSFKDKVPVVITKVTPGGHAQELGIEVNMELIKIGGEDITAAMSYSQVFEKIQGVSNALKQAA